MRVPFDMELAKRIQNGESEGRIVTREGDSARVVCWDMKHERYTICAVIMDDEGCEYSGDYTADGKCWVDQDDDLDLLLEVPEVVEE